MELLRDTAQEQLDICTVVPGTLQKLYEEHQVTTPVPDHACFMSPVTAECSGEYGAYHKSSSSLPLGEVFFLIAMR